MFRLLCIGVMLFSGTALPAAPLAGSKEPTQILRDAGISTEGQALIKYFKDRTLSDAQRADLKRLIDRLSDDSFDVREAASAQLNRVGLSAIPLLRTSLKSNDVEVAWRVKRVLNGIDQARETERIAAASRVLLGSKDSTATAVILAYLPSIPEDETLLDSLRQALVEHFTTTMVSDAALRDSLRDSDPIRREVAGRTIAEALPKERDLVRPLLNDSAPKVRFYIAQTLALQGEREAIRALLPLLEEGPMEYAYLTEDILCRLIGDAKPPATLGTNDPKARKLCREAWERWWTAQGANIPLARLSAGESLRGLTLICEVDGGVAGGRVWECGADGKLRWELTNVGGPVDVQPLPGGRLLIAEYYNSRVTERERDGTIRWESPKLPSNPVAAQRLPNGNTLISTMADVAEYSPEGKRVIEFPKPGTTVYHALRTTGGRTLILAGQEITEYDSEAKVIRKRNIGNQSGWAGMDILPNGNVLVAFYSNGNRYAELDAEGKTVMQHITTNETPRLDPTRVQRLRNGNTLVAGGNVNMVVEYGPDHKPIWQVNTNGRPFSVRRY